MKTKLLIAITAAALVIGATTAKPKYYSFCMFGTSSSGCSMEGSRYDPDQLLKDRLQNAFIWGFFALVGGKVLIPENLNKKT